MLVFLYGHLAVAKLPMSIEWFRLFIFLLIMKNILLLLLFVFSFSQLQAQLQVSEDGSHNFGSVNVWEKPILSHSFTIINVGNNPVTISSVIPSTDKIIITDYTKTAIQPGKQGVISCKVNVRDNIAYHHGHFNKTITVCTNDGSLNRLHLEGEGHGDNGDREYSPYKIGLWDFINDKIDYKSDKEGISALRLIYRNTANGVCVMDRGAENVRLELRRLKTHNDPKAFEYQLAIHLYIVKNNDFCKSWKTFDEDNGEIILSNGKKLKNKGLVALVLDNTFFNSRDVLYGFDDNDENLLLCRRYDIKQIIIKGKTLNIECPTAKTINEMYCRLQDISK